MNVTSKALYMPLSVGASVAGGLLAGAVFNQVWKRLGDDGQPPPDPKDLDRSLELRCLLPPYRGWCSVWSGQLSIARAPGVTEP